MTILSVSVLGRVGAKSAWGSYRVAGAKFLLSPNDSSGALSCVQSTLSTDDGLTLRGSAARLAPNLSDGVPIIHDGEAGVSGGREV